MEELFPDDFYKTEHISGSIVPCLLQFVFIVCQVEDYRYKLKLNWRSLAFT